MSQSILGGNKLIISSFYQSNTLICQKRQYSVVDPLIIVKDLKVATAFLYQMEKEDSIVHLIHLKYTNALMETISD